MMGPSGIEYPRDFSFLRYRNIETFSISYSIKGWKEAINQAIIEEKGGIQYGKI